MTAEGHLGKAPLLGDDAKHAALGSSEIPRISWRRAIGAVSYTHLTLPTKA